MNTQQTHDEFPMQSQAASPIANLVRFLNIAWYRRTWIISCLALSTVLGAAYYSTATRYYSANAELLILSSGGRVLDESGQSADGIQLQHYMPTYQRMLTCNAVLERAIEAIPEEHLVDLEGIPPEKQTEVLRSKLNVTSPRRTHTLQISFRSKSPQSAAIVVEQIVECYLEFMDTTHKTNARQDLHVLTKEKNELEKKLREKEANLLSLTSRSEVMFGAAQDRGNVVVERVVGLNEALLEAQKKRMEAAADLSAIEMAVRNGEDIQQFALQANETIGKEIMMKEMGLGSQDVYLISRTQQQLVENKATLNKLLLQYGPAHSRVREVQQQIAITDEWLRNRQAHEVNAIRQMTNQDLAPQLIRMARQRLTHAQTHEQSLKVQFESEKSKALQLNDQMANIEIINLDLKRMRSFYELLLERIKNIDLGQDSGLRTSITGFPTVQKKPISPKLVQILALSQIAGLLIGFGLVYVHDLLDDRFRTPDELKMHLKAPVLAAIRELQPTGGEGIDSVQTWADPTTAETEAFRTLRTTLNFLESDTNRLAMTSTESGDGKTTIISNLAVSFAQSGKKVLLIDGDMRRPGLTALLAMKGERGLSTILRDSSAIEESVQLNLISTPQPGLDVIPSGPRPVNPADLLMGDRFSELLAWAETNYDQILVDCPPLLAVADPTIVGRLVDGMLLVVSPEKNKSKLVLRSVEILNAANLDFLGVIANRLTAKTESYGYEYTYKYDYGHTSLAEKHTLNSHELEHASQQ